MRARLSVVVLSLLALACGGDGPRVHVATQGSVFDRGGTGIVPEAVVPFTITNRGDRTVFVPACGSRPVVAVDSGNGTGWGAWGGTGCIAIYPMAPLELRPGQSVADSYAFHQAGTYRVRVSYGLAPSGSERSETAASGPFEVR